VVARRVGKGEKDRDNKRGRDHFPSFLLYQKGQKKGTPQFHLKVGGGGKGAKGEVTQKLGGCRGMGEK